MTTIGNERYECAIHKSIVRCAELLGVWYRELEFADDLRVRLGLKPTNIFSCEFGFSWKNRDQRPVCASSSRSNGMYVCFSSFFVSDSFVAIENHNLIFQISIKTKPAK